jgi:hypothetical protein
MQCEPCNPRVDRVLLIIVSSESIFVAYSPFHGQHFGYCHVVFVDEATKGKVLEQLSSMVLHGKALAIGTNWLENLRNKPNLLNGWHPSSSSDVAMRHSRMPLLSPPQDVLRPIREGRQVQVGNIPHFKDITSKTPKESIVGQFYTLLHSYDVEVVAPLKFSEPRFNPDKYSGRFINFTKKEDAEAALSTL